MEINFKILNIRHLLRLSCFFLFFILPSSTFGQFKFTLQQAIDSAITRNIQIKEAEFGIELSDMNFKQSKNNLLPNLYFTPHSSVNWGRTLDVTTYGYINQQVLLINGGFNTQITLFQGGLLRTQILQNKRQLDADRSYLTKVKNDVTLSTATSFLQVLAYSDLINVSDEQMELAKLDVQNIEKSVTLGKKSLVDLAQAKVRLANIELNKTNLKSQMEGSLRTLRQLMYMPVVELELVKPNISKILTGDELPSLDSIYAEAQLLSPDLKVAQIQREISLLGVKAAKSTLYPSLILSGSIGSNFSNARSQFAGSQFTGFDTIGIVQGTNQRVISPNYKTTIRNYPLKNQLSDNFYHSIGLTLQIPIFNKFTARTSIQRAALVYKRALVIEQQTSLELKNILNQAMSDFALSKTKIAATQSIYDSEKQSFELITKRYKSGLTGMLEYNIAITNFNKATFDLINAKYEMVFQRNIISYYLGKPLTTGF